MVKLFSAGATHVGLVRTNNEDAYLAMPEAGLFALSDGMGGAAAGEVASKYFVETVETDLYRWCFRFGRSKCCARSKGIQVFK